MKRGDQVIIRRGAWKGTQAMITEVTSGGTRVGVAPCATPGDTPYQPFNLSIKSVEQLADFPGHEYEASYNGMCCGAMVELPDGTGDQCGEPIKSPIHDPQEYLRYSRELAEALIEWVQS
jgi:hypothetical protein